MVTCPECSREVPVAARSCPHCGKPLKDTLLVKVGAVLFCLLLAGLLFGYCVPQML